MPRIGIVGGGVAGTHLGLFLRKHGIAATIYSENTPAQQLAARLSNVVVRNGLTRARERALGVDHWDGFAPDLVQFVVTVNGPRPIEFSGALTPPAHVVDMRIYWARLLEDFAAAGGDLVFGRLGSSDVEELSARHDLVVVASGRGTLANLFPRLPEHCPYQEPQRVVVAALVRGIRYPEPLSFNAVVNRGHGEILSFPLFSFHPGLTALGIEMMPGGGFSALAQVKFETHPREFEAAVLGLLRDYAPGIYARVDRERFGVAGPLDVGHAAITPTVRRGYARLGNGRLVVALGDAHIVMDPVTGQGANKASHAAWVLGEAIRDAGAFDEEFCRRVEARMCEYALPVSDACNARLQPAPPHVGKLLVAAMQHQAIADFYTDGFNHPDHVWKVLSSAERTESVAKLLVEGPPPAMPIASHRIASFVTMSSAGG
jgi:2-polyprenyl-6-methoxyphenol hydroxylase-like FAD-dependent oxidoreductase